MMCSWSSKVSKIQRIAIWNDGKCYVALEVGDLSVTFSLRRISPKHQRSDRFTALYCKFLASVCSYSFFKRKFTAPSLHWVMLHHIWQFQFPQFISAPNCFAAIILCYKVVSSCAYASLHPEENRGLQFLYYCGITWGVNEGQERVFLLAFNFSGIKITIQLCLQRCMQELLWTSFVPLCFCYYCRVKLEWAVRLSSARRVFAPCTGDARVHHFRWIFNCNLCGDN